ncbi:MAG TPA: asparagine synthase-related protein, partial [Myxococcales bacterium]
NGMFAFALWDARRRRLLVARDRLGIKPLYLFEDGRRLAFASEAKAILEIPGIRTELDARSLPAYLALGYVPAPRSLFRGIRKLAPATMLLVENGRMRERRYWRPPQHVERNVAEATWIERVRAQLAESVRMQMVSDVPIGAFLSGGIDSSAVVGMMAACSQRPVKTYAIGFEGGAAEAYYNELPFARAVAARFRTEHHELPQAERPLEELPHLIASAAEPFGDPALAPLAALLRQVPGPVITGDGADELFAGHPRHLHAARIPRLSRTARAADFLRRVAPARHRGTLQRAAGALGSTGAERARAFVEVFSLDERRLLLGGEARIARGAASADLRGADASLAFDLEVSLPEDVLFRLNLARGTLETRTPYADVDLAKVVVPPLARHKFGRIHGRRLLREAVADLLPRDVLMQPARTLDPPLGAWLRGPLRQMLGDLVRTPTARIRVLLDPRGIDQVLANALRPRGNPRKAWALLCLELWARESRG